MATIATLQALVVWGYFQTTPKLEPVLEDLSGSYSIVFDATAFSLPFGLDMGLNEQTWAMCGIPLRHVVEPCLHFAKHAAHANKIKVRVGCTVGLLVVTSHYFWLLLFFFFGGFSLDLISNHE
eukprot:SAG31_NODE_4821_length_2931_cov_1.339689_2_plen_123_part_00